MNSRFSRIATSLLIALSLWTSAVATLAGQQQPSTQDPKKTEQKKDAQDKTAPAKTTQTPKSNLPSNEDPNQIGKRNINKGIWGKLGGSTEKEVALGRELAAEVDRQAKFVDDPVITEYVNRVGQNIVLHSDAKVPFTIKVIDSDEVNAFALPGGFFYVNKGLILAADNEAELAGVMAHEIAHVAARHAVENQAKATALQYGILIPAIVLGGGLGQIIYQGGNFGALLGFMKFSRGAEEEADKLGAQYLYAAGYDPSAMATMFEKLAAKNQKKPGLIAKAFATHPAPPDRRAASVALVARFPEREEYVVNTSEFQRVKGRLMRLSNARATTAGDISGSDGGSTGRPTLKRRQPTGDDTTVGAPDDQQPSDKQPNDPPKLKRRTEPDAPASTTQPSSQP
ncbi:MAG: M48 family metallopeptidase [Pyrinomonadaceae bacterium]